MSKRPKQQTEQSRRFKEAAREHGAEDAPDIDEVMRRLAAQKRREETPPKTKRNGSGPKGDPEK